ncbi:hypothetical protein PHSY_004550 [Pseudozyma hubeiensis SY62]|uniref:Uncharacterized protein n=1 Tax=Pseudozyma hubeiensis (strain SY62) TaxID=1305764 RepID=R9P6I1_PSEHS|nr:hypothetical protein PHSY_004550 [Pseudozyma hubeiensis SY62]GAC96966.1 hypothetical protein PHSY_004550 [Pseudozyma hubeiensis SY62]
MRIVFRTFRTRRDDNGLSKLDAWERRRQRRHGAMRDEARRGLKCVQATGGRTMIRELGRGARRIGPERAEFSVFEEVRPTKED